MQRLQPNQIREYVLRAQDRDQEAFSVLYNYYYDKLFAYCYRRTVNVEASRDIVSNVFLITLEKLHTFKWRHDGSFNGWIYRVCSNEVNHFYRKNNRYTSPLDNQELENLVTDEGASTNELEQKLMSDAQFVVLNKAIQQLKPIYQELIHLRYFEDLSLREIADATNKKEVTVRVYLYRALMDLRDTLKEDADLLVQIKPEEL